jgi:hypothetical protein
MAFAARQHDEPRVITSFCTTLAARTTRATEIVGTKTTGRANRFMGLRCRE